MKYDVAFVIPAKNEEKRIGKCLDSIVVNSNISYEIIVVDNGSIDNTATLSKQYNATVIEEPFASVAELRNIGAKHTSANYLFFLDADVELISCVSSHIRKYEDDDEVGILTGPILIPSNATWVERAWSLNRNYSPVTRRISWSSSMNMMIKKQIFEDAGGFCGDMISCEDVDLSHRVRQLGYQIIYDSSFKIIHHGEAKSAAQLYKKEKWRGSSIIPSLYRNLKDIRVKISFCQYIYFAIWPLLVFFVLAAIGNNYKYLIFLTYLPIVRSAVISVKNRNITHMHQLIIIWTIYFIAREHAILSHLIKYNSRR